MTCVYPCACLRMDLADPRAWHWIIWHYQFAEVPTSLAMWEHWKPRGRWLHPWVKAPALSISTLCIHLNLHRLNSQLSPPGTFNCDNRGKETTRTTNFLSRDGKMSYLKIRWSSNHLCYCARSRRVGKRGLGKKHWRCEECFSSFTATWWLLSFVARPTGLGLQLKAGNTPRK